MKLITKTLIASALFAAAAAPASAMVSSSIHGDVLSAAGANSNVQVLIQGDSVTLTGYAEDSYAIAAAERAAYSQDGVSQVINQVFKTN